MKIGIVGSGIAGLACAYRLVQTGHDVSLFEANDYFGGHAHTVDVTLDGITHGVDTGFLVFNHRTYPNLVALFEQLEVETAATEMSFSVQVPLSDRTLEWGGSNLDTVFAQRRNLCRPAFLRMLRDILRFNREATRLALAPHESLITLGEYLERHRYSVEFRDWYLLPMAGCIWSCPTAQMLAFPFSSFVQFCDNHGLLQVANRPQWRTVQGGARHYVEKMVTHIPHKFLATPVHTITRPAPGQGGKIRIAASNGIHLVDHVVLACHSGQALQLLHDAGKDEKALLSAIRTQSNRAVLHLDTDCLPQNRKTWSAWNYQSSAGDDSQVCVHYLINRLQPLPFKQEVIVSLNPLQAPRPERVIASYDYAHPVFDHAAMQAQHALPTIQGRRNTWFAGAWTGYGFHEDGLKSGLAVARSITQQAAATPTAVAA